MLVGTGGFSVSTAAYIKNCVNLLYTVCTNERIYQNYLSPI